jgi:DNA-binding Lrp family transcriptional regulator
MLTYGRFDIIMYMLVSRYDDIKMTLFNLRSRIFPSYDMTLYVVPFYLDYSFVPLREKFFEMLKERVWTRSAERPRPREGDLLRREFAVIKELSQNGREDFTGIDAEYGLSGGSARYTYHRMVESGLMKRITITMHKVRVNYISAITLQKINHLKYAKHRQNIMRHIISEPRGSITNKYALVGDIKMPEGVLFLMPVKNDLDMIAVDEELKKVDGTRMDSMIVTNVIVGSLCYRKFDNRHSIQYETLKNEYNIKDMEIEV